VASNAVSKRCADLRSTVCILYIDVSQRRQRAPADVRIIDSTGDFAYDASEILTTAGRATRGCTDATAPSADLSDNVVPCGALVLEGEAIGVVVATGANTLLGRLINGILYHILTFLQAGVVRNPKTIWSITALYFNKQS
jgi:magnesium-transporting ATPase (P-type)